MLLGVAILHERPLLAAAPGLLAIVSYQFFASSFPSGPGLSGLGTHVSHEWVTWANVLLVLVGFALLANQFERSNLPDALPSVLPDNWTGGFALLGIIFVMSAFLDNIAAAVIGGVMAKHLYHGRVSIAFLASIVAAANAGGAGSIIGDTTTTLMWIDGVSPLTLLWAYVAAVPAFLVFGIPGALVQQRHEPIIKRMELANPIDWIRVAIVLFILIALVAGNVSVDVFTPGMEDVAPVFGIAIWAAILLTASLRRPDWSVMTSALPGAALLVALIAAASLMPVAALANAILGLGFCYRLGILRVRQYSVDRSGIGARGLRLGIAGLRRRVWWIYGVVWVIRWCSHRRRLSGRTVRADVAT